VLFGFSRAASQLVGKQVLSDNTLAGR